MCGVSGASSLFLFLLASYDSPVVVEWVKIVIHICVFPTLCFHISLTL